MPRRAILYWLFAAVATGVFAAALVPARPGLAAPRDDRQRSLDWRNPAEGDGSAQEGREAPRPSPAEVEPAAFWDDEVAESSAPIRAEAIDAVEKRAVADRVPHGDRPAPADGPLPLRKREADSALPLARPGAPAAGGSSVGGLPPVATAAGSLAIVLALFFVTAWLLRRGAPRSTLALPSEVVEVLGRAPLPGKQQVFLLRCGHKLLLVWAGTGGVETLTEITDPAEVDRLAGVCRAAHPQSATAAFRQVFQQLARDPDADLLAGGGAAGSRSFRSGRRQEDDDV